MFEGKIGSTTGGGEFPELFCISEELFLIKEVDDTTLVAQKLKPTESPLIP